MSQFQRVIKYLAIAFAVFLIFTIISSIIFGISFVTGLFYEDDFIMSNMKATTITTEISNLDIKIAGTSLTINSGDEFNIETNNKYIEIKESKNKLIIKEKKHFWFSNQINNSQLIITIPDSVILKEISLEAGAGKIEIDSLSTDKLDFDLGAGKVNIQNLLVQKEADIDSGAGELTINKSTLTDLELDMGVGKVEISSSILGNSEINAGVGELEINLSGNEEDYKINIEKGIGNAKINNENITSNTTYGTGTNRLDIDGGVGNISVNFSY